SGDPDAEKATGNRERNGSDDDERVNEALELRRKNEEHDDDAEHEDEGERASRVLEVERLAAIVDGDAGRELFPRESFEIIERLAERVAVLEVRLDGDRAHPVVAVEARW